MMQLYRSYTLPSHHAPAFSKPLGRSYALALEKEANAVMQTSGRCVGYLQKRTALKGVNQGTKRQRYQVESIGATLKLPTSVSQG